MAEIKIGIIGGTGLDNTDILQERQEHYVDTPFGKPSDVLVHGKINGVDCILLSRHGRQHTIMPSNVNYRANIHALVASGCTHILTSTACGSLQQNIVPGQFVILDQFIDRTTKRIQTFYDGESSSPEGICHVPMHSPFCEDTRQILIKAAEKVGIEFHQSGTVLTIEGPRFSSRAESLLFHKWGADVINMTTVPEVVLAKEKGVCYASFAMATDYDSWRDDESGEHVNVDAVLKIMKDNGEKAKKLLLAAIPLIAEKDWSQVIQETKAAALGSIMGTQKK
ncbi:S-methyl-5'-thioadenosine phosphorylase-like [Anneissia japonica]|uniref:S-methyl-5'-thioadenosine phosphorylase-like n=1 Tax=Anneissia japonica TaxID=1529436 RepID=UPI0014259E57|nr:S-methyl-5'-thioadenosine phosphorylase-like [Anneissia japonica]